METEDLMGRVRAGLTEGGWIKANENCPFLKDCRFLNERCPGKEKIYDNEFSCAISRAWALINKEDSK